MDDTQPRHADGGAAAPARPQLPVTLLADADETAETALEDWSRGLDWVHWLFSSIRQRQAGIHFHAADLPQPGLYPSSPVTRQALAARWENFTQKQLRGPLGLVLVQAWQAAREQDLPRLLELDAGLATTLHDRALTGSLQAGHRLLHGTRGARYQGLLGRYRIAQDEGRTPGHFIIVWAAAAHFFQLSLASAIAEYIRLEWDLATRHLPASAPSLPAESIAALTGHLMRAPVTGLTLLGQNEDEEASLPQKTAGT